MQVAKYWRNKKLRYRLEGLARQELRANVHPKSDRDINRNGRQAHQRERMRLLQ